MKDDLEQEAIDAITKVFSDQSCSQSETRNKLKGLIDEIEMLIDTLEDK